MPFIPPGYAQANHRISLSGDPGGMIVTMGLKFDEIIFAQLVTIANDAFDAWADSYEAHVSNSYTLNGVTLYANLGGERFVVDSVALARPGLNAGAATVQNTAWLIKKRTALGGRANRGRVYHPGVTEASVSPTGGLTPTTVTDLQTASNFWLSEIQAIPGVEDAVVLHVANIPEPTVITSLSVDGMVATQRRRLR